MVALPDPAREEDRSSQAAVLSRVVSVSSNWTGRPVFCWITMARWRTTPPDAMSSMRSFTRSQLRSLLSIAMSNRHLSRSAPRF
jgi:hypothetical protein